MSEEKNMPWVTTAFVLLLVGIVIIAALMILAPDISDRFYTINKSLMSV
jgi:hypothetical protein